MELHGFTQGFGRLPNNQSAYIGIGDLVFTFGEVTGTGRIQVGAGADYNPLDLIESLYHHVRASTKVLNNKSHQRLPRSNTLMSQPSARTSRWPRNDFIHRIRWYGNEYHNQIYHKDMWNCLLPSCELMEVDNEWIVETDEGEVSILNPKGDKHEYLDALSGISKKPIDKDKPLLSFTSGVVKFDVWEVVRDDSP